MTKLNISLPTSLKRKLDAKLAGGIRGDVSDYLSDLIRRDLERMSPDETELALVAGLRSGRATKLSPQDWREIRAEVTRRLQPRRGRKAS